MYALLGHEFRIGAVRLRGSEPTLPCRIPSAVAGKTDYAEAYHGRGGIRAEVLSNGIISIGDLVRRICWRANVRFGSRADIGPSLGHVRFASESGPNNLSPFSSRKSETVSREEDAPQDELIVDAVYKHALPVVHKKSRGTERSQSRRHTSFAPSKARKLPCSRKALPVDDSRICVSTRICHSSRDRVWV